MSILEQLDKFHMNSGRHPNDFAARNVVVSQDGQCRLIDFHKLTQHNCKFDGTWNFSQKSRRDFGCLTLEIIAMGLRAWDRGVPEGKVKVYGFEYPITWYPSQKVDDTLIMEDECLQKLWNKSAALRWLRGVRVYVDQEDLYPDDEEDFMATLEYARSSKLQLSNTL